MNSVLDKETGFKETLPTVLGYLGISIAFGIIAKASGLSVLQALLISMIVYTGSAQFAIVSMLLAGSSIFSVVLATTLMSSRMMLMSMTLAPRFKKDSLGKNIFLGTLITDETFALSISKLNYTDGKLTFQWLNTANVTAYLSWQVGTVIGAVLGQLVSDTKAFGLDFAVVAMFLGLLYLQLITDRSVKFNLQLVMIGVTIILTYLGMIVLPSGAVTIVVTIVGCLLGMVIKRVFFN